MPTVTLNKTIEQTSPELQVTNRFAPGRYTFLLSVVDAAGNESEPAPLSVTIIRSSSPDRNTDLDLRRAIEARRRIDVNRFRDGIIRR